MSRDEITALFRNDLQEDELVLWAGQPDASVHLTRADALLIPLSIWIGSSVIRSGVAILDRAMNYSLFDGLLTVLLSVPFLLVGVYLIIGRFFYKNWRKKRTYYALTNRRVLVLSMLSHRKVLEQSLDDLVALHITRGLNGTGTITFGRSPFVTSWCTNTGMNCAVGFDKSELIAFLDINEPDSVYFMIDALRCVYDRRCYPFSPDMTTP